MNKLKVLRTLFAYTCLTCLLLHGVSLNAQTGFKWQGLAKDAAGNPVTQPVTLTFSILQNNMPVYTETHAPITPVNGQLTATVGMGTPTQGVFGDVDWSESSSLNVKMKVGNGQVLDMGISEIVVPPFFQSVTGAGGSWVGFQQLMTGSEGYFNVSNSSTTNSTVWTIATNPFSGDFEKAFENLPVQTGMEREFYIGLVFDIKTPNTGSSPCLFPTIIDIVFLPQLAMDYITTNYPNATVQEVTLQAGANPDPNNCQGACKYGVRLSNGTTLRFDKNGEFEKVCTNGSCGELKIRFYFPDQQDLGHEGQISINGNENSFGQLNWLKVPPPKSQFPDSTNLNCRLELATDPDCGTDIVVRDIYLFAIDRPNGNQPSLSISNNLGGQILPNHYIGGLGGKILIAESSDYVSVTERLVTPEVSVGTGGIFSQGEITTNGGLVTTNSGITSQGVINANGGINAQGNLNVNGQIYSRSSWPAYHWKRDNESAWYSMDLNPNNGSLTIYDQKQQKIKLELKQNGYVTVPVLEITGGADFAENFDITSPNPKPGMVVSIDPENPGYLTVSTQAYDRKVAGIISGAGGISPGMVMGQEESIANGKYPVAMVGRVYVQADAAYGKIEPGDMLTTSPTAGVAMKVSDLSLAQGATIGKAMTSLTEGQGLVMVLVNLK